MFLVVKSEILVDTLIMVYNEIVSLKYYYDCFRECNRRGDVLGVVNDFYMGLYLQMYQVWKSQGKTIQDSGFVIKGNIYGAWLQQTFC